MNDKPYIICVDDDRLSIDTIFTQIKTHYGTQFNYESASSGEEALEVIQELQEENCRIATILSDWNMPRQSGDAFLRSAKQLVPDARLVLVSAVATEDVIEKLKDDGILYRSLSKPCDKKQLLDCVAL